MKLQLALDEFDLEDALSLAERVRPSIDIIEIGTPFIIRAGVQAIQRFARAFPEKEILADTKIMDGGYFEAAMAFSSGASYVTVLGVTDDSTIKGCLKAAHEYSGKLVVDMLCVENLSDRARACESMGVDVLAVHTGVDQQAHGRTPLDDLAILKRASSQVQVAVAGGINSASINSYLALQPDIVIVGGSIAHADDPQAEASSIRAAINGCASRY